MTRFLLLAVLLLPAAAYAGPDPDLGSTVRADIAAQVIHHHPDYTGLPLPGTSGQRAADAAIRYQTGKLKPLLKTNGHTDVGGQGGSSDQPTVSIPLIESGPQ
ncbi:MAG: hypothetical protein JO290_10605 [Sphingomonadaceae bacterium]|nr:hypothetical protein [Sphingomonadaceae bacterium]